MIGRKIVGSLELLANLGWISVITPSNYTYDRPSFFRKGRERGKRKKS